MKKVIRNKNNMIIAGMEFKIPMTPNCIIRRKDGSIPISFFTEGQLKQIAKCWTEVLIENANKRRKI